MKSFSIPSAFAAAAFLAMTSQAIVLPTEAKAKARSYSDVTLTFHGATPSAFYTVTVPADGEVISITDPLSISTITSSGDATCEAKGIDGSDTFTNGAQTVAVGPPQTQISVSCESYEAKKARSYSSDVTLTFHGATPSAFYSVTVPADGELIPITNPLSISTITSSGDATCEAKGIDGSDTVIYGATTVPVGPPQTQIFVSCEAY